MMNSRRNKLMLLFLCIAVCTTAMAQHGRSRDPLTALSRAISAANATALSDSQKTQLTTLVTNFKAAQPTAPDATLDAAENAFYDAILAGNLTAANAQATIISNREAALHNARLQAEAQFLTSALGILKSGGQLDTLIAKFGSDEVLDLVESLIGGYGHGPGER